jgi:hypothetical protein
MADFIWACDETRMENFGWFEPWFGADVDKAERLKRSGKIASASRLGVARPVSEYPLCTLATRGTPKGGKHLVAFENRNVMVSDRMAEVLSEFDFGDVGLVPTPICKRDRSGELRELGFRMHYLRIAARKKTLRPTDSVGVTRFLNPKNGITLETRPEIWNIPDRYRIKPDDLAFDRECLDGPDLWVESGVPVSLFISDRLAKTLKREKLHTRFELLRCRVVG